MKNYKKFFYLFAMILFSIFFVILTINYFQMEKLKKKILQIQANNLVHFIESTSKIYQKNFTKYKIPINKKTIHLMPIVAIRDIVKDFSKQVDGDIKIKMISDKPRNPKNKATKSEMKVLNILKKEHNSVIKIENNEIVFYKPLYISQSCLKCHLSKDKTPTYIKNNYYNAYGYKLGELRGAIVVIIKNSIFLKLLKHGFIVRVMSAIFIYILILIIVYFLLKKIEALDKKYISELLIANKKMEEEKEKAQLATKAKSEFLANMSHEIRTPLNAMFGFIKLLEEKKLDEEGKKYLYVIKKSGELLLNIINDILDFSKIESGKLKIEMLPFNLDNEINIIYQLFENRAQEKSIKLHLNKKNTDVNIVSDPTRLKQIISNLLSNAIKFTAEKKNVYLTVSYNKQKDLLYVEVKDEGIGIPQDKIDTIFESFSQVDSSTTRKYGGTGLGLAISKNLVELLGGGKLKVESTEGNGSRFYFTIPVKKSDKKLEEKNQNSLEEKYDYYVLLVEDNKANQMFMKVVLKKLGLKFDIANDGLEAVEMYKQNYKKYKLILMDENMPNMTGSEATIKIREFEKENDIEEVQIVAVTANVISLNEEKFFRNGFNYYLSKPLDIDKLKDILRVIK